jgi:DivIVA domain-containing protein
MLLVIAVVAAVAAVATGRITGAMDDPVSSLPARPLPDDGEIGPADVARVRFSPALRGYRMEEVDRALDRLVAEISRRDELIADLRERLGDDGSHDGADAGVVAGPGLQAQPYARPGHPAPPPPPAPEA